MRVGELIAGTSDLVLVNVSTCRTCGRRVYVARRFGAELRRLVETDGRPHVHAGERAASSRWAGTL